ncbi:hypothetical protein STRTUCAR8_04040 [Streptomyces turgidiscabies Car8]|uniref:Uncharacterized protein n=1 Tax=Streptomyces turgidiscabies (strain Car8) TaxID=698760 RepID=L7F9A1_STRT8|nr:hypothetical protein STRTUCAR8_04040 [Streptomyces turgidiscabies Car8]
MTPASSVAGGRSSPALYTARISFVPVFRTALNQRRQPAPWFQRSAKGPFGLSRKNRYRAHSSSVRADGSSGYGTCAWPP